ncbi:MAG TPA: response regulator [Clostridiaceae bacterium]|nr:response regulator [Clostridiaceae bacterium]
MYKMIVVDDESPARNAMCDCFPWDEIGFEITAQLDNGKEAKNYIDNNPVDVVFCDIVMPVMSGIELAKTLYESNVQVKLVFLSGHANFEYARKALCYGVKNYILKPVKYKELVEVFSRVKYELDLEKKKQPICNCANDSDNDIMYNYNDTVISVIIEYIEKNYRNASLEEAASLTHMNPNYLSQFFKSNTGINFSKYLLDVRMKKARDFLKDIRYRVYDVGHMVGYSNSKNFTRAFKRYYGKNPSEFRNR